MQLPDPDNFLAEFKIPSLNSAESAEEEVDRWIWYLLECRNLCVRELSRTAKNLASAESEISYNQSLLKVDVWGREDLKNEGQRKATYEVEEAQDNLISAQKESWMELKERERIFSLTIETIDKAFRWLEELKKNLSPERG